MTFCIVAPGRASFSFTLLGTELTFCFTGPSRLARGMTNVSSPRWPEATLGPGFRTQAASESWALCPGSQRGLGVCTEPAPPVESQQHRRRRSVLDPCSVLRIGPKREGHPEPRTSAPGPSDNGDSPPVAQPLHTSRWRLPATPRCRDKRGGFRFDRRRPPRLGRVPATVSGRRVLRGPPATSHPVGPGPPLRLRAASSLRHASELGALTLRVQPGSGTCQGLDAHPFEARCAVSQAQTWLRRGRAWPPAPAPPLHPVTCSTASAPP